MKITVQREGYEVTAEVYGASGSPYGDKPSLEVDAMEGSITDPSAFKSEHDLEPTDENLAIVMAKEESRNIEAILEDAYEVASGGDF